ncbi:Flagellar hook-length control protein fliK [Arthrobacter sp. 9AX]|uniref:hypothetical protein n=1 Tax=Arthrobacter sp. 9AX TaxID=2653131 RepID=UPI0012F2047E|nr:hypothetical protein [Arthrobacter sp. 9AX]VXB75194.1 Flagellar hook-length control protein fliK [Arthrobacter sp. 9AX]
MGKVAGRKKRIIGTTIALVAISGGAAFAYWTATGSADTTTKAGASKNFTVTSSVAGDPLSPNGPTKTATFTVTNPGTGVQKLSTVTAAVAGANGAEWTAVTGCSAADFKVGTPVFTQTEIKAGESVTGTVTLQMVDRPGVNQDGCQGADVPLHIAAS